MGTWGAMLANGIDDGWPETGFVRLPEILKRIPVSKSTWYEGIKEGRFPQQVKKFGTKTAMWDVNEIRSLLGTQLVNFSTANHQSHEE